MKTALLARRATTTEFVMYKDSWNVMRQGETPQALSQMQENYAQNASGSTAMELGVAYLWLERYVAAWNTFDDFNQKNPHRADCTYDMAGVAKWCLDSPQEAIKQWKIGLTCDYKDAAGLGVRAPLLLYFASVVHPELYFREEAESNLAQRTGDSRISVWPGPLAQFLLGDVDEHELRALGFDGRFEDETILHNWSSDFFVGVLERARGNIGSYQKLMEKCSKISWDDFDEDQSVFLGKMWSPEFFLARHEAGAV